MEGHAAQHGLVLAVGAVPVSVSVPLVASNEHVMPCCGVQLERVVAAGVALLW